MSNTAKCQEPQPLIQHIVLSSCQPDTRPDVHPNCTADEEKVFETQCSEVLLSNGFKPCHSLVPPEAFLGNCIYDMCEYDGMEAMLCDNVQAYAQACQSAGVTISWRNNTFCREFYSSTLHFQSNIQFYYLYS